MLTRADAIQFSTDHQLMPLMPHVARFDTAANHVDMANAAIAGKPTTMWSPTNG